MRILTIRPLTDDDIATTSRWQIEELPRGFFAHLGRPFICTLQRAFLSSPYGIGLAAVSPDRPQELLGFVLGSTDARRHAAHVVAHHRLRLAMLGAAALMRRPSLVPRFLRRRAARYARRLLRFPGGGARPDASPAHAQERSAVLSVLIVAPEGRGRGTGSALAEAFVREVRSAGSSNVALVTRADETGAAAFWKRLGWEEVDVHQNLDGDLVSSFIRRLEQPGAA